MINNKDNLVYQYTSIETLFKIVQHNNIWFSDLLDSNDSLEDDLVLNLFIKYLKEIGADKNFKEAELNNYITEFYKSKKMTRIYGLCLTENRDLLSLWMTYGKENSVAIAFDRNELKHYFKRISCMGVSAQFEPIIYIKEDNIELRNQFKEIYKKNNSMVPKCFNDIIKLSPFYKKEEWQTEREVRCVFRNFIDSELGENLPEVKFDDKNCNIDYYFSNGFAKFHYDIPFDVSLIKEIIIGPNNKMSRRDIIFKLGLINDNLKIRQIEFTNTEITYR